MKKTLLLALLFCSFLACKSDQKKESKTKAENTSASAQKYGDLPALPADQMNSLIQQTSYIDYIFYNLPFSISQDNRPSILANIKLMSSDQMGPILTSCQPLGREFFHIGGQIAFEAEIYFQDGCFGYVFLENEKPKYANKVSAEGMKFYSNIINQAKQIQNKALNAG